MPTIEMLEKYARLAVRTGVNIQKGQLLIIQAPVEAYEFARLCQKEAYLAGSGEIMIQYEDDIALKNDYLYESEENLVAIADWKIARRKEIQDRKCAFLYIDSDPVGLMSDVDPKRIQKATAARRNAMHQFQSYTMNNIGQWSIVAIPNARWASRVFPNESQEDAIQHLWDAIFKTVYIDETNDPIEVWKKHSAEIQKHCEVLNSYRFQRLHFQNELGTDLTVELPEDAIWGGGDEEASGQGCLFNPNIPTEEVFTTPHRSHVDGVVYASKPLSYNGRIVENFCLTFEDGVVVDAKAEKGMEALQEILDADENSRRLGEVALISYDSPISKMNLLFFDTLFDENASCHLALGASYPTQLKGGSDYTDEELEAHGGNVSTVHVDFMFGSREMRVEGITPDGKVIPVFEHGNFVF